MFKRSRRKIIAAIMGTLVLFIAALLCVVYVTSYNDTRLKNEEMLREYAARNFSDLPHGGPGGDKDGTRPPEPDERRGRPDEKEFRLSTFYSVVYAADGSVASVDNGDGGFAAEDELVAIADSVVAGDKSSGRVGDLLYKVEKTDERTVVAFMNVTVSAGSMNTLLRMILLAGGVSVVVVFFIAVFLARVIVKPLEENDVRQKRFVSDAGHELKTPISIISTNTELLARQGVESEWLSNIRHENERMGTLVAELLDLSRAESTEPSFGRVDLSRLVTGETLPFESVAFEKGRAFVCDVEENVFVNGNENELKKLVSILLDNAIKHGDEDSAVTLTLKNVHREAVLSVENAAPEIAEADRARLFERFYRVDGARNSESGHYGLGLSIAKAVADKHKGKIEVDCRDGKVRFAVMLPLAK